MSGIPNPIGSMSLLNILNKYSCHSQLSCLERTGLFSGGKNEQNATQPVKYSEYNWWLDIANKFILIIGYFVKSVHINFVIFESSCS